jgi:DNA-directed RNA polymerase subunit E'/Rpb7
MSEGPDRVLDNVTSILADVREKKNELIETEKLQIAKACKRMLETKRASYKKNGVELLLSHTDKVRVRLVDDSEGSEKDEE